MRKIKTTIDRHTTRQTSEYEFQKVAIRRNLITTQDKLNQFKRIEAGVLGEYKFEEIINLFGPDHWSYMQNVWLRDFTDFECDYLLFTNHCVYVFEIKNYFGKFEYANGQCSSRGVDITYNPINQARNATVHLRNIFNKLQPSLTVKGVLVFIGEHNHVEIHDDIDYIDILSSNEIYQYIQEIITEENCSSPTIDSYRLIQHLKSYTIDKPYQITPYSKEQLKEAKFGISCVRCKQFNLTKIRSYFKCSCGQYESKEEATVRTACEYGALTFGSNFTVSDIHHFMNKGVSRSYLIKVLDTHFEMDPTEGVLTFCNFNADYVKISNQFVYQLPRYFVDGR